MAISSDNFKVEFKRYKQRSQIPNFADVIDIVESASKVSVLNLEDSDHPALKGLKPVTEWKAYTLDACPGFIIILNPFEKGCQRYWVDRCIETYPQSPNITNIDPQLSTVDNHDVWKYSKTHHSDNITGKQSLIMKLRWVTLGYHYDWDNKMYYPDRYNEFPGDLSKLCKHVAYVLGYKNFSPEAGIVNYYHMDSTLAGHTDHSELDHDAPLISISFGQDAIFLIGGITKETKPSAIMLHSGDICVMSGQSRLVYHAVPRIMQSNSLEESIFTEKSCNKTDAKSCDKIDVKSCDKNDAKSCDKTDAKSCDKTSCVKSCDKCTSKCMVNDKDQPTEDERLFRDYLNCTRININVRQVLKPNEKFPSCASLSTLSENKRLKLDLA